MADERKYAPSVALDRRVSCYPPDKYLTLIKAQSERTGDSASRIVTEAIKAYYDGPKKAAPSR
jgi:hypothetical protein